MGLGHFGGGIGAAKWYASQGHHVIITDQQPAEKLADSVAQLRDFAVEYSLGSHDERLLDRCDLLIVSPAVDKQRSAFFQSAVKLGVPWTTEINEFCRQCPAPIVGVTGSAGKSTTASMIFASLVRLMGADRCHLGGNIGQSLLPRLPIIRSDHLVVLELSSFMLEDLPLIQFSPHVAVVTNLVNNHLDRHRTMEAYAAAKINILRFQKPRDAAVLNRNDAHVNQWGRYTSGRVIYFDSARLNLQAPGSHNQINAAAALAAVEALGFSNSLSAAIEALEQFESLPHRMESVGMSKNYRGENVTWINDSKATTPESTLTAVNAVPRGQAVVIVGGADKQADMSTLAQSLVRLSWGIITIGSTGPQIAAAIKHFLAEDGRIVDRQAAPRLFEANTLAEAVKRAHCWITEPPSISLGVEIAAPSCVLLSPACASYDQFDNYEHRGAVFRELVTQINSSWPPVQAKSSQPG